MLRCDYGLLAPLRGQSPNQMSIPGHFHGRPLTNGSSTLSVQDRFLLYIFIYCNPINPLRIQVSSTLIEGAHLTVQCNTMQRISPENLTTVCITEPTSTSLYVNKKKRNFISDNTSLTYHCNIFQKDNVLNWHFNVLAVPYFDFCTV